MSSRMKFLAIPQGVVRGRITSGEEKLCGSLNSAWNYVDTHGTAGYGIVVELTRAEAIRRSKKAS